MRIVYFVHGWPPDRAPNGVASAIAALAPAIREAGHDARILALVGEADAADATLVRPDELRRELGALRRVRDRLRPAMRVFDSTPRAIAARINATPGLAGADLIEMEESFGWSRTIARNVAAPVVTRLHGPHFLIGAAAADGAADPVDAERVRREGRAIAAAACVTAPSRFVLDAVRARYGLALRDAVVIPNAVRPARPSEIWRLEDADRAEILFVGRFDRIKGADILLRAFALLAAQRPNLKLTFAGPHPAPMTEGGRSLDPERFVASLMSGEAADRIRFLGTVRAAELPRLRRRAFLTIVSSRIETFSGALLEALASGAPVVATRVGGIPEIARDGEDAALVDPEDARALAAAVGALLDAPERAARLGESGRRRVEAEYAPSRVASLTLAYYQTLLSRAGAGPRPRRADKRG